MAAGEQSQRAIQVFRARVLICQCAVAERTLGVLRMIDYAIAAETYDHTRTHSDEVIDRFCTTVPLSSSISVLDFGCGTGNYLSRIHQRFAC